MPWLPGSFGNHGNWKGEYNNIIMANLPTPYPSRGKVVVGLPLPLPCVRALGFPEPGGTRPGWRILRDSLPIKRAARAQPLLPLSHSTVLTCMT